MLYGLATNIGIPEESLVFEIMSASGVRSMIVHSHMLVSVRCCCMCASHVGKCFSLGPFNEPDWQKIQSRWAVLYTELNSFVEFTATGYDNGCWLLELLKELNLSMSLSHGN